MVWPQAWQMVEAMAGAVDAAACARIFKDAVRRFHITTYACGEIDLSNRERTVFYAMDWPVAWREFYTAHLIHKDPLLRLLSVQSKPFLWSEMLCAPNLKTEELLVMSMAERNGWVDGFVLPVPRGGSRIGLVSLVSARLLDAEADKSDLILLSSCFHERLRSLIAPRDFPTPPLGLSVREIECLGLVAQGLSDNDVAAHLSIAPATAHEHIERAKQKLKARSRAQAVALAMDFGVIRQAQPWTRREKNDRRPSIQGDA